MYSRQRLLQLFKSCSGFSLVEMSAAMAAVAAIVVVTVGGSALVDRSRLGRVITDIETFSKALVAFDEKYKAMPGDIADVSGIPGATAGNGNGTIDTAAESLHFWRDLALSKMITGKFDGLSTNDPGKGVPAGPIKDSGYNALNPTVVDAKLSQAVVIEFSGFTSASNSQPILSPEDAKSIDAKIDDGKPNTGMVRGVDSAGDNSTTNCATSASATATYNVNSESVGCRLRFIVRSSAQADDAVTLGGTCNQAGLTRISDAIGDVCPPGTMGKVIKTCRINTSTNQGTWETSASHCQPIICSGGKKFGEKRILPCMGGQIGTGVVQTCSAEGVWVTGATNNTPPFNTPNNDGVGCSLPSNNASYTCTPDGTIRAPQPCNWGQAGMVRQTCGTETTGRWSTTSNTCSLITCTGGTIGQTRAGTACSGNYAGPVTETCSMDGNWKVTSNKCLPVIGLYTAACTAGVTADLDIACPPGETGENVLKCVENNKWAPVKNTCKPITCAGERVGSTRVIKDAPCPKGRVGVMVEVCESDGATPPKGRWVPSDKMCATVMCDAADNKDGNASWPYTAADGSTANGTCRDGYTGTPTRTCTAGTDSHNLPIGVWGAVSNPCTRITCAAADNDNATWSNAYSKTSDVTGQCNWPYYEGVPTKDCDLTGTQNGTWSSAVKTPCEPSALPVKANLQLWLDAADYSTLYSDSACKLSAKDNGGVGCLKDKSGNGNDALQSSASNMPVYTLNTMNSRPVLNFTAANAQRLDTANSVNLGQNTTFCAVVQYTSPSSYLFNTATASVPELEIIPEATMYAGIWTGAIQSGKVEIAMNSSPHIVCYVYNNSGNVAQTFLDGVGSAITTAPASNSGAIRRRIGGHPTAPAWFNGKLAEMLVYNKALSTGDRSDVEVYLSNKWGISVAPPVTANMTLWLDASDNTSMYTNSDCSTGGSPGNGAAIACWKDKSGSASGANFVAGNAPTYYKDVTANGRSAIRFNGSSNYLIVQGNDNTKYHYINMDSYTFIAALKPNALPAEQDIFSKFNGGVIGPYYMALSGSVYYLSRNSAPWGVIASATTTTSPTIYTGVSNGTKGIQSIYINGIYAGANGMNTQSDANTVTALVGARYNNSSLYAYLNADLYEFMVYTSALTTSQRIAVEAYLMRKWGIDLPKPLTASGLSLWLDANNQESMFYNSDCANGYVGNNTLVGCVQDASRNSYNAIQSTSDNNKPKFYTGVQNGKPVLSFDGTDDILATSAFTLGASSVFSVVRSTDSSFKFVYEFGTLWSVPGNLYLTTGIGGTISKNIAGVLSEKNISDNWLPNIGGTAILSHMYGGTHATNNLYVNGALANLTTNGGQSNNPGTTLYSHQMHVGSRTGPSLPMTGNIDEMVVYDRAVTDSERCDIESYLSVKWGVSVAPCGTATAPTVSNGLVLWLDSNDSSTLFTSNNCITGANPTNGSGIGCWADKSGAGNHATQITSASRPTYTTNAMNSKPVLRFDGNNDVLNLPNYVIADGNIPYTVFTVVKETATLNSYSSVSGFLNLGNFGVNNQSLAFRFDGNNNRLVHYWWAIDAFSSVGSAVASTPYVFSFIYDTSLGRNIYINGASNGYSAATGRSGVSTSQNYVGKTYNTEYMYGDIAEILVYNRTLSTAERQNIENTLGLKWGISVVPVTGMVLWLDGQKSSTFFQDSGCSTPVTANGQSVGCWKDSSGQGLHFTAGSAGTYNTSSANGKPGATFSNSTQYLTHAYSATLNPTSGTFFLVSKVTGGSGTWRSPFTSRSGANGYGYNIYAGTDDYWQGWTGNGVAGPSWWGVVESYDKVSSAPGILSFTFTDGNQKLYKNGVLNSASVKNYTPNNNTITYLGGETGTYSFYGDINEVMLYNSVLSSSNREAVETYLGSKWGINVTHLPGTGMSLWLDATDRMSLWQTTDCSTTAITGTGQGVACWKDKTGNGHNVAQGSSGNRPTYTTPILNQKPVLRFDGNDSLDSPSTIPMYDLASATETSIFFVLKSAGVSGVNKWFSFENYHRIGFEMVSDTYARFDFLSDTPASQILYGSQYSIVTQYRIVSSVRTSANKMYLYIDGLLDASQDTVGSLSNYSCPLYIGQYMSGLYYFNGDISEIMMYQNALSDANRQTVERYLGSKWGISVP